MHRLMIDCSVLYTARLWFSFTLAASWPEQAPAAAVVTRTVWYLGHSHGFVLHHHVNNLLFFFEYDFGAYVLSVFARNISKSSIKFRALSLSLYIYIYISYSLALSGRGSRDRFALGCFLPTLEGPAMDAGTDGQAAEVEWQSWPVSNKQPRHLVQEKVLSRHECTIHCKILQGSQCHPFQKGGADAIGFGSPEWFSNPLGQIFAVNVYW